MTQAGSSTPKATAVVRGALGLVSAVSGSVVDATFPAGALPKINHAVEILWDGPHRLIV